MAPGSDFFKDISDKSGIRAENYAANPTTTIPINDRSRLAFADLNGDGYEDIVAHNLYPNPKTGIPFEHLVFMNKADGTFKSLTLTSGINDLTGKESFLRMKGAQKHAWADIDHDGDLDLLGGGRGTSTGRPNFLFENLAGSKNPWPGIALEGDGKAVNRDALGARVTLSFTGKTEVMMRERHSSRGSYNPPISGC